MRTSNLKNFSLLKSYIGNAESRILIGDDGSYWPFDLYMSHLHASAVSTSSVISYATDIAFFLDYITEASNAVADGELKPDSLFLNNVFVLWPQFMLLTKEQRMASKDVILRVLGARLDHEKIGESTVARRIAALNGFLELSDRFHQILKDRATYSIGDGLTLADDRLLPQIIKKRDIKVKEKRELISNSMLAGVISRGPKLVRTVAFKRKPQSYKKKAKASLQANPLEKAFPPERIKELISAALSYRDKAYLSFLAASGVRGHEARQILWEDIDPVKRTVRIVPPWERRYTEKWNVLTAEQQENVRWKGRETELTFLLEPYASMFWEYLSAYRNNKKEWSDAIHHSFVFVTARRYGYMPLLVASSDSISDIFKKPLMKLKGLPHYNYGAHSLRHAYGVTLAWGLDLKNGETGLPINFVRDLMGHKSITSTEIYTKPTTERILEVFNKANKVRMMSRVDPVSLARQIDELRVIVPEVEVQHLSEAHDDE